MEPTEQLSSILPTVTAVVERIEPRQLDSPTPCRNFSVHDVIDHMITLGGVFAYWFRGEQAPEVSAPQADGGVPSEAFRATMEDLLAAVRAPGAMERTIPSPMGDMAGEAFARLVAFDGLVHGWDLARATGQRYELPSEVVDAVDRFARGAITPEMRDGDTFAAETPAPEDASPIERVVAFSGRSL